MSTEHNFCFPMKVLENERLRLEPFDASKYARPFYETMKANPVLWSLLPSGPFDKYEDFDSQLIKGLEKDVGSNLYAVLVRPQAGNADQHEQFAGTIGFLNSSTFNSCTEIGWVVIFPQYQRTFVASNAVGLMLQYGLDSPSQGGLGLRRLQWQATAENKASIGLAKRMGMTFEGIARWQRTINVGKAGNGVDPEKMRETERYTEEAGGVQRPGRHSAVLSMCWDDWLIDGKREEVLKIMDRRS